MVRNQTFIGADKAENQYYVRTEQIDGISKCVPSFSLINLFWFKSVIRILILIKVDCIISMQYLSAIVKLSLPIITMNVLPRLKAWIADCNFTNKMNIDLIQITVGWLNCILQKLSFSVVIVKEKRWVEFKAEVDSTSIPGKSLYNC